MTTNKEDLEEIINSYKWIKVKKYVEEDSRNPMVEWKSAYHSLAKHHKEETKFLINKCRELAKELLKKDKWESLTFLKGLKPLKETMSDNEIVEYYYKHIELEREVKYDEERDSWYYKVDDLWFEHSGSDIHLGMKYDVLEHKKQNNNE